MTYTSRTLLTLILAISQVTDLDSIAGAVGAAELYGTVFVCQTLSRYLFSFFYFSLR